MPQESWEISPLATQRAGVRGVWNELRSLVQGGCWEKEFSVELCVSSEGSEFRVAWRPQIRDISIGWSVSPALPHDSLPLIDGCM